MNDINQRENPASLAVASLTDYTGAAFIGACTSFGFT